MNGICIKIILYFSIQDKIQTKNATFNIVYRKIINIIIQIYSSWFNSDNIK